MTIKVGVIGCGGIAAVHARGYLAIPDEVQVTAVADVAEENARTLSETLGGARVFADVRDLLAQGDVDAVDVCLPHHLHRDAIMAAAAAGKHILCEKPLCLTLDEAADIRRAVRDNAVTLMCAHNQLYYPAVRRAKELLDAGALGCVYELRTVDTFFAHWLKADGSWRNKRALSGGGELIDTGYHPTYTLLYLAASAPSEVTALLSQHRLHDLEAEDSAQVLVRFADGTIGNIVTSWAYELPVGAMSFHVVGERGQLYGAGSRLWHKPAGAEPVETVLPEVDAFAAEIADFVACLRDGRAPLQTEQHGTDVLALILGAYRSEAEKRTVSL